MLKYISRSLLLGNILLLGCCCGSAFAQSDNNSVTVEGTVNVNGQVSVDGPVQIDVGQSPNGSSDVVGDMDFRSDNPDWEGEENRVNGLCFDNTEGLPGANGNYFGYLYQDQSTWYTPNFFTWEKWTVVEPFDIQYKSRFGYADYNFRQRFGVKLILPMPDWEEIKEKFSVEVFGCSKSILWTKWTQLWTYRGSVNVEWQPTGYMGQQSQYEQNFKGEFKFTQLTQSGTWRVFVSALQYGINFFICVVYFVLNVKLLTNW